MIPVGPMFQEQVCPREFFASWQLVHVFWLMQPPEVQLVLEHVRCPSAHVSEQNSEPPVYFCQ